MRSRTWRRANSAGLAVDDFAPQLSFFFNAHNGLLEEIAKFRAARRLWAHIMRERFGARDPRSLLLRFHVQTAGSSLTAQQPENNIVRTAIQALAAVLGGCQSLHTNALDEALALPTEDSALIALRTQQILAYETGVANTVDPVAGSYAIENLTDRIEAGARDYIARIDAAGGMLRAIETSYVQGEVQKAAYEYQQAIERGEQVVVGVNKFQSDDARSIPTLRLDPEVERAQVRRVQALRARRDAARTGASDCGSGSSRAIRSELNAGDLRRGRGSCDCWRNLGRAAPCVRGISGIGRAMIPPLRGQGRLRAFTPRLPTKFAPSQEPD